MGYRVVAVCPAGRRRYMKLLAAHVEAQRESAGIDEMHWWVNTFEIRDIRWLEELAAGDPQFHKLVFMARPGVNPVPGHGRYLIGAFLPYACDPDTIYVRLDDDVVWLAPDALRELVRSRLRDQSPLVYANIVNNSYCDHVRAAACGIADPRRYPYDRDTVVRCSDRADLLHRSLLADIETGFTDRWKMPDWTFRDYETAQVNVICWFGRDLAPYAEFEGREEPYLATDLPRKLGRPNRVCGSALAAHFAFGPQRLELDRTTLLTRYTALAPVVPSRL